MKFEVSLTPATCRKKQFVKGKALVNISQSFVFAKVLSPFPLKVSTEMFRKTNEVTEINDFVRTISPNIRFQKTSDIFFIIGLFLTSSFYNNILSRYF